MTANAFASTFLFFSTHRQTLKNKKELASQRTTTVRNGQTNTTEKNNAL